MPTKPFQRRILPAVAGLVLLLAAGGALAAGQVGEVAAPFILESLDGGYIGLAQFSGEVVVLHVIGYG